MGYHWILALFALDQKWKTEIEADDPEQYPKMLAGSRDTIKLFHNRNDGFPFRTLAEKQKLVRQVPLAVLILVAGLLFRPEKAETTEDRKRVLQKKTALYLVFFGGLSNYLDRLRYGYVIDYFSFQFGILKKVVFNIGDLMVFAGTAWFSMTHLLGKRSK